MELIEKLSILANKIRQQGSVIHTEEATKNAFVMPFISTILGYDVFDPTEVTPEFVCDIGTKKGEKIDYAIHRAIATGLKEIQILFEVKKYGEVLNINHSGQLFRYFHVTNARIGVLTNGQVYKFFTDLDAPNKMDEKPFLELDLLNIDEYVVPELAKLSKSSFDIGSIINAAGELKYVSQLKRIMASLLSDPDDEFIKLLAARVYEGSITQKVKEQFAVLVRKAATQFLNEQINERLKSAINSTAGLPLPSLQEIPIEPATESDDAQAKIITSEEETEGYYIVKAIVRSVVDCKRIVLRDTQSYCGILLDDNNRKPICRLHFNRTKKYIGLFDDNKTETRVPIEAVDDIYNFSDKLKDVVKSYLD